MNVSQNLRCFIFSICALLAVATVLVISSPTLSEPSQDDGGKSVRPTERPAYAPPRSSWSRFYPASEDCAEAKVDIWLARGVATYSMFVPGAGAGGQRAIARVGGGEQGTTMLFGAKDCLISIRVERAPAGTSIDND